jgi:hypothetical protein
MLKLAALPIGLDITVRKAPKTVFLCHALAWTVANQKLRNFIATAVAEATHGNTVNRSGGACQMYTAAAT